MIVEALRQSPIRCQWDDILALLIFTPLFYSFVSFYLLPQKQEPGFEQFFAKPQEALGLLNAQTEGEAEASRDIAVRLKKSEHRLVIFYGSQSGHAMRFAKQLARELLKTHGIPSAVEDLDAYDHEHLATLGKNIAVGFVVSTFGEGDPPDNATGLYETLSRWMGRPADQQQQEPPLKNLRYFAFGLGSTKYQAFNGFVKTLDAQLLSLGAQRLGTVGLRDEADSRTDETAWRPWKDAVVSELFAFEPSLVSEPVAGGCARMPEPDFVVEETAPRARLRGVTHAGEHNAAQSRGRVQVYAAPVKTSRLLSTSDIGPTSPPRTYLHMEFDLSGARPPLSYTTGDHVAVWPVNNDDEVGCFQQAFGWSSAQMNAPIEIRPRGRDQNANHPDAAMPPSPTTRASLLRFYFDIGGVVTRETLQLLAHFAPSTAARQRIDALNSDEVVRQHLTCGQIMAACAKDAKVWPQELFALFLTTLPPLQPRYFSIASSPHVSKTTVAITVGVVATPVTPSPAKRSAGNGTFHGLATNYLQALHERVSTAVSTVSTAQPSYKHSLAGPRGILAGNKALLQIRPSSFRMPADPAVPLILVAAGSGIAPFVAFMQERERLLSVSASPSTAVAPTVLFFGCRAPDQDYLYAEEWARLEKQTLEPNADGESHADGDRQPFFSIYTAFSRAGPNKVYVQHRVQQEHRQVARLLTEQGAAVYICGSTAMATEVKAALHTCLETAGLSSDAAQLFMRRLKKDKKLQEDVWA